MKNEPSEDALSPYTDFSVAEDEEKPNMGIPSTYPQTHSSNDSKNVSSGIATYVPAQKREWRRYKLYTRDHIMAAIEDVRKGMSALQSAKKYGVPSRTLYDKVKKLGITTSRPLKRGSNGSTACFPYGLTGTNSTYENEEYSMNNNSSLIEASFFQHILDGRGSDEREALANMASAAAAHTTHVANEHSASPTNHNIATSPSPSPVHIKYIHHNSITPSPAAPGSDHHHSETNGSNSERDHDDNEDQVEDLSIGNRKQESRVIMSPMNQVSTIKKKEDAFVDNFKEDLRREVSVDDAE